MYSIYIYYTNSKYKTQKHLVKRENYNLPPPAMCFQAFIEIDVFLFPRLVAQTLLVATETDKIFILSTEI